MLTYILRESIFKYRIFAYESFIRYLCKMSNKMHLKKERSKLKYEKFKTKNRKSRSKMARYINN